jgi:uncharacterized protein YbaR (Trm112 family)
MDRVLIDLLACPLTGARLEPWSAHDDEDLTYGVLCSDAAEYPVVEGIPVMFPDFDDVVALVRAGRHNDALLRMVLHDVPRGGAGRLLEALTSIRSTRDGRSTILHRARSSGSSTSTRRAAASTRTTTSHCARRPRDTSYRFPASRRYRTEAMPWSTSAAAPAR